MRVVEQILRADQERERKYKAAMDAVSAMERAERQRLLAELIRQVENEQAGNAVPVMAPITRASRKPSAAPSLQADGRASFVQRAETHIASNPGCTTDEVSQAIGQNRHAAYGTLRHLARSRGTVELRDGKWWPKSAQQQPALTNRAAISTVLGRGRALNTGQIFQAVLEILPDAQKGSVASEVNRMKGAGLIVERGVIGRGPGYILANGGSHANVS
jgi:hypothetical protein